LRGTRCHRTIERMTTDQVIQQFNDAFQTRSPELLPDLIAEDCVMEAISPAPDGTRTEGRDACLRFWQDLIDDSTISFDVEDVVVRDDRAIIRWRLNTPDESVRGVNLMHVEDGKIVEALGYAKRP
jgi:ketosteroid isomerase-like protein